MKGRFVYFIKPVGLDGPVKIGCSEHVDVRLASLAAWSPMPLEIVVTIPGGFDLERNIHECMARSYSHREWFHATDEVTCLVRRLVAGLPIEQALDLNVRYPTPWRVAGNGQGKNTAYRVHLRRVSYARAQSKKMSGVSARSFAVFSSMASSRSGRMKQAGTSAASTGGADHRGSYSRRGRMSAADNISRPGASEVAASATTPSGSCPLCLMPPSTDGGAIPRPFPEG